MRTILLAGILSAASALPVGATLYSAGTHAGNCSAALVVTDPVFATDTGTSSPTGGGAGSAGRIASASAGGVTGAADGSLSGAALPGGRITQLASCESALLTLDDVVITGPGSTVATSFSVQVDGSHSVTVTSGGLVTHSADVQVTNLTTSVHTFVGSVTDVVVTSPAVTQPVGVPFSVSIKLDVEDTAMAFGGLPASTAQYNSSYSATFPVGTPVFDLPAGFTVNSASGNIVNNFYQSPAVGVEVLSDARADIRLAPATPNPMNAWTALSFEMPRGADARLDVYDVTGARVRGLVDGWRAGGSHSVRWDGRNDVGQPVSAGVYFYRLTVEGKGVTGKVVRSVR
ncbi:MAG: hypothetical protein HKN12_05240 [Gemmatimonadetes bacterium]|nr:hypothetical protein [Gemmatimonadota bacterium]